MAVLKTGAETAITGPAQIDTLTPLLVTASKTLAAGTDQKVSADPSLGDIELTLPDATSNAGLVFFIKRITNSDNVVKLLPAGVDTIDRITGGFVMGLIDDYIQVYSDGTNVWKRGNQRSFSFGALSSNGGSFAATTTPSKLTTWDTVVFTTPQKLVPSTLNNNIDAVSFQGPIVDTYKIDFVMTCEFTNNQTITAQMYANGALVGVPVNVNALGTGKPVSISIHEPIQITSATQIEIHISVESNGTIESINASFVTERIGG